MKKCKITVMRMARYDDLMERYENPIEHACDLKEGQVFIANGWEKPEGLYQSDAVVVPALCVHLDGFTDADQELVEGPAERDVIVPCGASDGLVVLRQTVVMHEKAAGIAVIGLRDLIHEIEFGPGVHVKVLLVLFRAEIFYCSPCLQEVFL